jgi:signal transduction histidine kinase
LRILVFELRPETLAVDSVYTLLRRLSEALASRGQVELELDVDEDLDLPEDVRVVLYRVAQEAVNNIARHSRASRGSVLLQRDGADVRLVVHDDGGGFDPSAVVDGMGRSIMKERAASIGAALQVESSPELGTTVLVTWRDSGERKAGPAT